MDVAAAPRWAQLPVDQGRGDLPGSRLAGYLTRRTRAADLSGVAAGHGEEPGLARPGKRVRGSSYRGAAGLPKQTPDGRSGEHEMHPELAALSPKLIAPRWSADEPPNPWPYPCRQA